MRETFINIISLLAVSSTQSLTVSVFIPPPVYPNLSVLSLLLCDRFSDDFEDSSGIVTIYVTRKCTGF